MSLSYKLSALADYYDAEKRTEVPVSDLRGLLAVEQKAASEFEEIRAAREDQLRQLLSYCRTAADQAYNEASTMTGPRAYRDMASKLAAILDGES